MIGGIALLKIRPNGFQRGGAGAFFRNNGRPILRHFAAPKFLYRAVFVPRAVIHEETEPRLGKALPPRRMSRPLPATHPDALRGELR